MKRTLGHGTGGEAGARAGRARVLLLALAGAALLIALLALVSHRPDRVGAAAADASAAAPGAAGAEGDARPDAERVDLADAGAVHGPGDLAIPVGVRLHGAGRLEGSVRERGSGAGVPGVRVDLQAVPPAGLELARRIFHLARFGAEAERRLLPIATAASGSDGRFAFEDVRAGTYFLEARGSWCVPDGLGEVTVAPSGAGGPVVAWVRAGGRVLGRVTHADGRPSAGADVWCYPGPGNILRRLREGDVRGLHARTDEDGSYVFHGVPPGRGFEVAAIPTDAAVSYHPDVVVEPGGDTRVDVVLREAGRVRGRVLARSGEEEPRPVAGAHVGIVPRGLRDLQFSPEVLERTHAVTRADGSYTIDHAPPGTADVIAWAEGAVHGSVGSLIVTAGGTVDAPDVVLARGPQVDVHVTDATGAPLADVRSSWWVADWSRFRYRFGATPLLLQSVQGFDFPRSDAEGHLVAGPFPGTAPYHLFLWKAGYQVETPAWSPGDGPELAVTLHAGGDVEGIVMDLASGEPVPRFELLSSTRLESNPEAPTAWNAFSGGTLVEDEGGRFLLRGLAPGKATVRVQAEGFLSQEIPVEVTEGRTTRGVIVTLRPGGTVRGRVVDGKGEPVAGAQVLATDRDGEPRLGWPRPMQGVAQRGFARQRQDFALEVLAASQSLGSPGPGTVLSDDAGRFEITSLPEGPVTLRAWHRDYARGESAELQVVAGAPLEDVELRLSQGGSIVGTVTDRYERPVPDAIVVAAQPDEFRGRLRGDVGLYQGQTDAEGRYAVEHLPGGSYVLFVTRGDAALDPLSLLGTMNFDLVHVPEDATVTYDLVDSSAAGTRVHGLVTSAGLPVEGGTLLALSFEGDNLLGVDAKVAAVGSDGTYEFPGLEPGDLELRYQGDAAEVTVDVEIPDEPTYRLDVALPEGGVTGRVVDAATGEPIARAQVFALRGGPHEAGGLLGRVLSAESGRVREITDEEGRYRLERLQEGAWVISAEPPRGRAARGRWAPSDSRSVTVHEGLVEEGFDLALEPARRARGFVRAESGEPLAGARVSAYPRTGGLGDAPSDRTDAEGRFELVGLAPGTWDVGASLEGYADAQLVPLEIGDEATPDLELVLTEGVPVQARVLDASGRPVAGATGRLVRLDGPRAPDAVQARRTLEGVFEGEGLSGVDGVIDLGRHVPGSYRLEVARGAQTGTLSEVEISPGVEAVLDVTLH